MDKTSNCSDRKAKQTYLRVLREMTPEQKLQRVFELSEMTRQLFRQGLHEANPHLTEDELISFT